MPQLPLPRNGGRRIALEAARVRAIARYTPTSTRELQAVAALATRDTGFAMSMISLIDDHWQRPLAGVGAPTAPFPVGDGFCSPTVAGDEPLLIADLREDGRFAGMPGVTGPLQLRAYAGVPLHGREGLPIGSLCVLDVVPRELDPVALERLVALADIASGQLELDRRRGDLGIPDEGALVREARDALGLGQLEAWYQPLVRLGATRAADEVIGAEALVRWRHPERGVLQPSSFLAAVEDTELAVDLDAEILGVVLRDLADWGWRGPRRVSVNMSGPSARDPDLAARVISAASVAGVEPRRLTLELTEGSLLLGDAWAAARMASQLDLLRAVGCEIHLDDMGTGWNSLEYLLRLPCDGLKVDRVFASALGTRRGDAVVHSLVALAHDLGLALICEGVETAEQAARAYVLGCRIGQGYVWGSALPPDEALARWFGREPLNP